MIDMEYRNGALCLNKLNINDNEQYTINDPENRTEILLDSSSKIISYRKNDGTKVENIGLETNILLTNSLNLTDDGMTEFQQALKDSGFNPGGEGDWSDYKSVEIPMPRCAIANITNNYNTAIWPQSKGVDLKYYIEFWDMQGNYFKKEIIFNAQGNSSMAFAKKNGAADFCNNNGWDDDDTFYIKFGDWVPQDSFHFKAYHTDFIRGGAVVAYQIADEAYKTRGIYEDRPWKKALINFNKISSVTPTGMHEDGMNDMSLQIDNGARCMPDGFPCIFYLNGEFYGIYSWQLKKHRDNYHLNNKKAKNIHLDGDLYTSNLWGGTINWTGFELRNPKNLVYATAHNGSYKYDADVAQDNIAGNDDGSSTYDDWVEGSYPVDKIVKYGGHYYINSIPDNEAEPVYDKKNNGDDAPDFKNKTKCGWINCTNTIKVKNYVIDLSKRIGEINSLDSIDSSAAKELFDTYFDADNLIDYQLINMAVHDTDGFGKNWQWITYDGVKWYVCQYDKDMSFGNYFTGMFTTSVTNGGWLSSSTSLPVGLALRYYRNEHITRWKELVNLGIFTASNIESKLFDWVARIGQANYEKEWNKWPEASCNRDSMIDFENWEYVSGSSSLPSSGTFWNINDQFNIDDLVWFPAFDNAWYLRFKAVKQNSGKPCLKSFDTDNWNITGFYTEKPSGIGNWDKSTFYNIDDDVLVQLGTDKWFKFTAIKENQNCNPYIGYNQYPRTMGYRDSIWRFCKYVEENIINQNAFINSL